MASSSDAEKTKMITVRSSDLDEFEVEEAVAMEAQTIRHMIEDDCADSAIPLFLAKVIEYCKKHVRHAAAADSTDPSGAGEVDLKSWDAEFVKVDQATLFHLVLAADYLSIKGLLDLTCQTVADMMKDKTVEEMREIFHIKNDFAKEEDEIRRENKWAFE